MSHLRLVFIVLVAAALSVFCTCSADGSWYRLQITDTSESSSHPRITRDNTGTLHLFWEEDDEILHQSLGPGGVGVEVVGQGTNLDLMFCPACDEISLAWIDTSEHPTFRAWQAGEWSEPSVLPLQLSGAVAVAVAHHQEGRVLWMEPDPMDPQHALFFTEQSGGVWSAPMLLAVADVPQWQPVSIGLRRLDTSGRLLASWGAEPNPFGLFARAGSGDTWSATETINDWMVGQCAVDTDWTTGLGHFAGNGPQPVCPCNSLHYVYGTEGAWSDPEDIGSGHYSAEMEWPQEVSVHVRPSDGVPFVVWRHEAYQNLSLVDDRLLLGSRTEGTWSFSCDIAINRGARQPDVTTALEGYPIVVWSDDSDGAYNIYLASTEVPVGVADEEHETGHAWRVVPNPGQSPVTISWDGPLAPSVDVATLSIFDVQGRAVRVLRIVNGPGPHSLRWDGLTKTGAMAPSGRYLLRLRTPEGISSHSLTLIR